MATCSAKQDVQDLIQCLSQNKSPIMYDELLEILQDKIDTFQTTIKEDKALLADPNVSPQRKVMISARMHRKSILVHNFRLASRLAAQNGGKEPPPDSDGDEL